MSDENESFPESAAPEKEAAPVSRRISNPRPKKAAKPVEEPAAESAPAGESEPAADAGETPAAEPAAAEDADSQDSGAADEAMAADWPEPEGATGGAQTPVEGPKRKRRRKKKGGAAQQNATAPVDFENSQQQTQQAVPTAGEQPAQQNAPRPQNPPARPKIDADVLAKRAWKIYLAEISEEGVALVGDNDAKELCRRCFRLAEIFIEEQSRRR